MRPEAKQKLGRLLLADRIKTFMAPAAILAIALIPLGAFGVWQLEDWTPGRTYTGTVMRPPITGPQHIGSYALFARLESGATIEVTSFFEVLAPKGARISVQEDISRVFGRKRYRLIRVDPSVNN